MKFRKQNKKLVSIIVLVTYFLLIVIQSIAMLLPLNGRTTIELFESSPNLFIPLNFIFNIWLLVYILLGLYTIYQFKFNSRRPDNNDRIVRKVNIYFIMSNIINILWIITWHYQFMIMSLVLIVILIFLLIQIRITITHRSSMNTSELKSIQLPFSIYYGWMSVILICNSIIYLDNTRWGWFGFSESMKAIYLIIVCIVIAIVNIVRFKDYAYGLVFIWLFIGILYNHTSVNFYNKEYSQIIQTTILGLVAIVLSMLILYVLSLKNSRRHNRRR